MNLKKEILEVAKNNTKFNQSTVIELVKKHVPELNIQKIKEQYYRDMANELISSIEDKDGTRNIFAVTDENSKTRYVDISRTKNVDDLNKIKFRLMTNVNGNSVSLKKVEDRIRILQEPKIFI